MVVAVDARARLGPVNRQLGGIGWTREGGPPLATVAELHPPLVRLDASLEQVSTSSNGPLHLDPLLADVARVRAIGAEPLVILCYTPGWLGAPNAHGRDPTKVKPADLDAWEQLVHRVVLALATAPAPALRFEAWNEPDIPIFWQDSPQAWADTVAATGRAVARVARETGRRLAFGGPATAFPDPVYLGVFLSRFRDRTLPLDFVSWHWYGNDPFFGPDGQEPIVPPTLSPVAPVLNRRNPLASPSSFGDQVPFMRQWTAADLAGSGRAVPPLLLDEWNVSAGGFDHRHDTNEGAAFDAGVLSELQAAGVDAASFFRAGDSYGGHQGDWGLVTGDGQRKPAWWTFWLWGQQAPDVVEVTGASGDDGLWATASAGRDRVTVLLSSFSASQPAARDVDLAISALPWPGPTTATVRRIDHDHPSAATAEPIAVSGGHVRVHLPAQAVAFVELRRGR